MNNINTILAIDTSCDDTSVAVVEKNKVLSNVISSQVEEHKEWGGVVPGLAKKLHEERIDEVVEMALEKAGKTRRDIEAIAVTQGPGLAIALEVGIRKAKNLAVELNIPFIPVDHMEGHLFSSIIGLEGMDEVKKLSGKFPALGILVSGGHTELIKVDGIGLPAGQTGEYELLGETLDDAIGEAFDKVAKMLGLGYPGGPVVAELAENGKRGEFDFPVSMKNSGDLNLSYSGLKTAVLYKIRELQGESRVQDRTNQASWEKGIKPDLKESSEAEGLDKKTISDICASFQFAAIETLMNKVRQAVKLYNFKTILLGGGVAQNKLLQNELKKLADKEKMELLIPDEGKLFMDNAAMIGFAGWLEQFKKTPNILTDKEGIMSIDRHPGMRIARKS
ncbi:tRNA (adenosine(37)-N6)-threonylcarbamoyltransferase complex transferase subunit TsaD [Candidatus Dojkabacteria bacterium]|nr:tRNA (adenosine(37)-N6)-threonylcarbamoyltransferase complex transferase subunit TsaD [Candidatus Dojkabacteria bacterium]